MAVGFSFMTKSPRKNVPDVGIELGAACMPNGHAFDRATAPGYKNDKNLKQILINIHVSRVTEIDMIRRSEMYMFAFSVKNKIAKDKCRNIVLSTKTVLKLI